jgi:hypothetical protein
MHWKAIGFGLALALASGAAHAGTTKDFLYRCSTDEAGCAAKIKAARRMLEQPPPGRTPVKLCLPASMSDEGLVGEVTYWIDEQSPPLDNKDEFDSIAAALTALYTCSGIKGLEGDHQ